MLSDHRNKFFMLLWLLPGFLLWAAFPPLGETADSLFALAPLMWLSRTGRVGESTHKWLLNGLFFWVATLSWMPAIVKNGGPWPLVVLGWIGLAAYCAIYFAAYGYLSARYWRWARSSEEYGRRLLGVVFVEPVLWCGLELVRSRLFGGFAWNQLGVAVVNAGFGSPAELGGVYLCSAIVVLVNGTFVGIAERMMRRAPRLAAIETILAFVLIAGIYSQTRLNWRRGEREDAHALKVALIQRNFPCCFAVQDEDPFTIYSNLVQNVALMRPDLVVLPESALSEFGGVESSWSVALADSIREATAGGALLAGGGRREGTKSFNSAALYDFSGGVRTIGLYDKVHLVPFGEYIPFDKLIPVLQRLAPVGSCTPGLERLLDFRGRKLGIAICFEDTDSALMRRAARAGAQALVFMTNDSWFSRSVEAEQHAWQALARAIETGLPVVRVGNNGLTGTLSPAGEASWLVGPNGKALQEARGTMFDRIELPSAGAPTVYVVLGDWPLGLVFSLLIFGMILVEYRSNHEKRRDMSL